MAQAVIIDDRPIKTVLIENSNYSVAKVKEVKPRSYINQVIPFRIKFTNIGVPGYGPNNVPGIGIQVIGYSNYIL